MQPTGKRIATGNDRTDRDVGQGVPFGDKTFEGVKEFVYLRSLVTSNNGVGLWTAQTIAIGASFKSKCEKTLFLVFEGKALTTICDPKQDNGVTRRRYNLVRHMIRRPKDQKAIFTDRKKRGGKEDCKISGWMECSVLDPWSLRLDSPSR
jgi:hypothetical protein